VPAVEIRDIRKTFKDFFGRRRVQALDGLSITVQPGEVYGLLGPNGSGKTTTFKIALGLVRADSGEVSINGHKPGSLAARKSTGYLPEDSTLLPFLSARESLRLHGALAGLTRAESKRKADELLEKVGLKQSADRRVLGFSKGMQRRLGVASVLVGNPEVFILDEPTSGLDPLGAVEMKHLIADLRKQGKAVLISSHLLGELENVCDRVGFLNQGKMISEGTLEELLREKETHELRVSPADPESVRALEALAKERGLKVVSSKAPMRSLEAFYLGVLGKDPPK